MNREILERPFASDQIKQRHGTNGYVLDYIEGCAVIQRLNECFDAEWIFEIQDHRVYDDEVVVLGKLTLQGISKSQFGKSRITRSKKDNSVISLGDDLKAAATDCLKKCATLFGVALHLYEERNGGGAASPATVAAPPTPTASTIPSPAKPKTSDGRLTNNQLGKIYVLGGTDGRSDLAEVLEFSPLTAPAGQLRRTGLSRADRGGLKAGDAVTIKALAARDGSNSGLLQEITTADGRVFKLRPDGTEAQ